MKIKEFLSLLIVFVLGSSLFTSCSDDDDELIPELKLITESVDVAVEGGTYSVNFQLINPVEGVKVKAVSGAEWINVTEVTDKAVLFEVAENTIYESRESEISLSYPGVQGDLKCKVVQTSSERPVIKIDEERLEIDGEGAENVSVKYSIVNAKEGILPEIACNADWITDINVSSDAIMFNVMANGEPVAREAEVNVTYKDAENTAMFIVAQAAGASDMTVQVGNVSFKMIYIKAGTFVMGAAADDKEANSWEKPAHKVTLTKDYYMGEYEVTQDLWVEIMGSNPSQYKDADGDLSYPVENVNLVDIDEFIAKLNEKTGLTFVLPTEAQWEYAARGGSKSNGYKYSGSNVADDVAWHDSNSEFKTHPVGQKLANELGLYDMCGNVMEWCSDWYGDYSADDQIDPVGPDNNDQNYRVARGGGLISWEADLRVTFRAGSELNSHMFFQGFRLALVK